MDERPAHTVNAVAIPVATIVAAVVVALVGAVAEPLQGLLPTAVIVYTVAFLAAVLVGYLLGVTTRVRHEPLLEWMTPGYFVAALGVGLTAVSLPSFLRGGDMLNTGPNAAAALYLVWHATLIAFAVAALAQPQPAATWRRWLVAIGVGVTILAALEPVGVPMPGLARPDGTFTTTYRVAVSALLFAAVAVTVAWMRRVAQRASWSEAWITIGLAFLLWDLALDVAAYRFFGALWWASVLLRGAQFAVPAAGLLSQYVKITEALDRHERSLAERLNQELALAYTLQSGNTAEHQAREEAFGRVRRALDAGDPGTVYQPIYDLRSGELVGVEALSRFLTLPNRPPHAWFDDAHEGGLGLELEVAAARKALDGMAQLPPDAYLAVNVSPSTVQSERFHDLIARYPGDRVVLEVTEHAPVDDYSTLHAALRLLAEHGVRLAVDDAGAGFASLRHVVRLDPTIIKLDLSLTRDVHIDPVRRSLALSLVTFAHENGKRLVAEGIEHPEELRTLQDLGVHCGQGFGLCRPCDLPVRQLMLSSDRSSAIAD